MPLLITFILIYSQYDDNFITTNTNQLVDRSNSSARQLAQQNHAFDVVIFQK